MLTQAKVTLVKPCRVVHLILDKIFGLKFLNYRFLNLLNPQLKSMKARREKSKTKFKKKKQKNHLLIYFPRLLLVVLHSNKMSSLV